MHHASKNRPRRVVAAPSPSGWPSLPAGALLRPAALPEHRAGPRQARGRAHVLHHRLPLLRCGDGLGPGPPGPLAVRSDRDLLRVLETTKVDLYLDQQAIDNTTPAGRMFFHITGAFAEFERDMIRSCVNAGLARAKARAVKLGQPKVSAKAEAAPRNTWPPAPAS